jgi:SRSO17 transposase
MPGGTAFATKPALARQMITRALEAGTPAAWVTADEVYGQDPQLRAELSLDLLAGSGDLHQQPTV